MLRRWRAKKTKHPLPWMQYLLHAPYTSDYRGIPTYVCPCGSDMFLIAAIFDGETQEPGMYLLDGGCMVCGAIVSVPCPADGPDPLEANDDMYHL